MTALSKGRLLYVFLLLFSAFGLFVPGLAFVRFVSFCFVRHYFTLLILTSALMRPRYHVQNYRIPCGSLQTPHHHSNLHRNDNPSRKPPPPLPREKISPNTFHCSLISSPLLYVGYKLNHLRHKTYYSSLQDKSYHKYLPF